MHTLDTDVSGKPAAVQEAPSGLIQTLLEFENSKDRSVLRAFKLLKILSMFPRGEEFQTLKRFNGPNGFYPQDVITLINAGLVDTVEIASINASSNELANAILVRRPVREYLCRYMPVDELISLNTRSLEIYFGKEWALKGIKPPPHLRFTDLRCGAWQIGNASMLILRSTRSAVENQIKSQWDQVCSLATAYCTCLASGNHFAAVISFCEDVLPLFESLEVVPDIRIMCLIFARSLRMTGEYERSIKLYEGISLENINKSHIQSIHLNLALCYQAIKRSDDAKKSADACIKINPASHQSLQAQSITISLKKGDPDREKKLRLLLKKARKNKAFIAANNIALNLAEACKDIADRKRQVTLIYEQTIKDDDNYNAVRAIIKISKIYLDDEVILPDEMLMRLIQAYNYLYADDLQILFNECHAVLWRTFESRNEIEILFRLFRYSSFRLYAIPCGT